MLRAVRRGDLAFVRSVDPASLPPSHAAAAVLAAADVGDLAMLQLLHERGYPWHPKTIRQLACHSHTDCLRYADAHGCPWHPDTLQTAVDSDCDVDFIQVVCDRLGRVDESNVEFAAFVGDLAAMKAIGANEDRYHCWWVAMEHAARQGHVECLAFAECQYRMEADLREMWDTRWDCLKSAAECGQLAVLQYAVSHAWIDPSCGSAEMSVAAAQGGHLACLQFLYEHGWTCHAATMRAAIDTRHFACVAYLHSVGCPYFAGDIAAIARHALLPLWRDHVRARAIALYWAEAAGRTSYAPDGPGRKRDRAAFEADGFF